MSMTTAQHLLIIGMVVLGTVITRVSAFIMFPSNKPTPKYVQYLGKALPSAVLGMLVIYCLKNVSVFTGNHAVPELISIAAVVLVHQWKKQMLLSITLGTVCYMLLIQYVF